ncbi:MAG: preprotein translocase subunit SecA [Christensenellaceae bacterium]|nr:preprotein translocase subunit SecA [Christensenellaceae bacterium]
MGFIDAVLGNTARGQIKKLTPIVNKINALEKATAALSHAELRAKTDAFRAALKEGQTLDDILPEAYAAVREAARRTIGQRHYDVQLIGGIVLHQGRIAEMKTGEGKTITETLPAYLNALTGRGVHIVTVNDYLASRDAQWMGKIYRYLGLTVGCIIHDLDSEERREAYACDITYGTNNEFGFDYLRDNMVVYRNQMVQRELHYAIVDEVDSILVDEARTPLIISGHGEASTDMYERADRFVCALTRGEDIVKLSKSEMLMGEEQPESGDYMADIKARTVALTQEGIRKAEQRFNIEDISATENTELNHHIHQALKAHALFQRDKDYVVQDGQVLIVDEFTGRLMLGRRYSDGLHQALEAKEKVKVERENKTLATITFQNYFRMYEKLAGMTGTAKTEESEFQGIYDLDVVEIPTNQPLAREDCNDVVYATEAGKFRAVVEEIQAVHQTGQPILVGTVTVEKSELLSAMLDKRGIRHTVLNAKRHAMEAEIVAQAGKYNAVTIATNMAGRGTDILLGGNPEFLARRDLLAGGMEEALVEEATGHAETQDAAILDARGQYAQSYARHKESTDAEHVQVVAVGGLHIIGTERHESRRIDNQLRGRAGRQGDPGSTRFYISMEDDLMRRFGGERVKDLMARISPDDDIPIEVGLLTKQIENAQKRVESYNFDIRKNVLQYDDVMNRQREIIYGQRRKVLMGEDIHENIGQMIQESVALRCAQYCPASLNAEEWDIAGLRSEMGQLTGADCLPAVQGAATAAEIERAVQALAEATYAAREADILGAAAKIGADVDMREIERSMLLRAVDAHWMDHIDAMDQLRQGIGLQAIGQKDPVVAYRNAGFDMFDEMVQGIREMTVRSLYHVVLTSGAPQREQLAKPIETAGDSPRQPKRVGDKISRNAPCPCGSGKKYKQCCGKDA